MTKDNYSLLDARDLGRELNNIMVFYTSGCVEPESEISRNLEELMIDKIARLEDILLRISDKS